VRTSDTDQGTRLEGKCNSVCNRHPLDCVVTVVGALGRWRLPNFWSPSDGTTRPRLVVSSRGKPRPLSLAPATPVNVPYDRHDGLRVAAAGLVQTSRELVPTAAALAGALRELPQIAE
jgi:hypothetical protein